MVTLTRHLIIMIISTVFSAIWTSSSVFAQDVEFGINGHPYIQEVYKATSVEAQISKVQEGGFQWYRSDWYEFATSTNGIVEYNKLIKEANKKGIKILPVIIPPIDLKKETNLDQIYKKSFDFAFKLVTIYKNDIDTWELNNEMDNYSIISKGEINIVDVLWKSGIPRGDKKEHYSVERYNKARSILKGLADGVVSADKTAKRIINSTYMHIGFMHLLIKDNVDFEIIGWHWYSDMGDMTKVRGNYNLLEQLKILNKPIWITEFSRRNGSYGKNGESEHSSYIEKAVKGFIQLAKTYPIKKIFVYELLDEPHFGLNNVESHYGIIKVNKNQYGKWSLSNDKQAFFLLKGLLHSTNLKTNQ